MTKTHRPATDAKSITVAAWAAQNGYDAKLIRRKLRAMNADAKNKLINGHDHGTQWAFPAAKIDGIMKTVTANMRPTMAKPAPAKKTRVRKPRNAGVTPPAAVMGDAPTE